MATVAVVLSGCGVFDGSEIHEAVAVLYHLSRLDAGYQCFAPDMDQLQVIDHVSGKPTEGARRNVLTESARITRGKIQPLRNLRVDDFDAVVFPGGFGAAKNLCDFAIAGASCTVHADVDRVIRAFHDAHKPVGMCCIAPVLAAKVLGSASGGPGVKVTIGNDAGTAEAIQAMGSTNIAKPVAEALVDTTNRLITTPAYMCDAPIHHVFAGIGEMVERTLSLIASPAAPVATS